MKSATKCAKYADVTLVPHSSVSLLLGFSAMLTVSLVAHVTTRSLYNNMLGCLSPSGEWS